VLRPRLLTAVLKPRFAVIPGHEEKAFIPYSGMFKDIPNNSNHAVVSARVTSVKANSVEIDRSFEGQQQITFDYLVIATGTRLTPPSMMPSDEKSPSVGFLRDHQAKAQRAQSVVLVGGGAVGVQMALDLKERYPEKDVTVVQSRNRVMPQYHSDLHDIVARSFQDAGIRYV
jgi:pyruvate/2-oxoglutarate dehydrogenase complex dihydrolipoamide dehydrogenase (E3) component